MGASLLSMPPQRAVPLDTAAELRELADRIEDGRCVGVSWVAIVDDEYQARSGSSPKDGVVQAALLMDWSLSRMRMPA